MATLDILQDPKQTPEQILANEQLQWLMQKGITAENIQDDALTAALVDPSAPNAPTSLTLTGSGSYQDDKQGLTRAFVTLSWVNPTANFGDTVVLYRQTGQTLWMHATRTTGTTARIEGLECGLYYDFGVQAVSQFNVAGAVTFIGTNLMPGDTGAPSAPGTPTIVDKKLTTITFAWSASASKDTGGYECEIRTASGGGGSQVWTGKADSTFITVDQATIGFSVTHYFRVRGLDYTKNAGSWTSDVSFSFAKIVTADVGATQITSAELASNAVTTAKVVNDAITVDGLYSNDASFTLSTTEQEIGTLTISTDGGSVIIMAKTIIDLNAIAVGSGLAIVYVRLRKDSISGALLDGGNSYMSDDTTDALSTTITVVGRDAAPSATQTYKLTAQEGNANSNGTAMYRRICPLHRKK